MLFFIEHVCKILGVIDVKCRENRELCDFNKIVNEIELKNREV